MTAFVDAMIFLVVIMIAISVTITSTNNENRQDAGPDELLTLISRTEVRLSDITDIEDDTLVYLPDIMALSLIQETEVEEYLGELLDSVFGMKRYFLRYEYDDNEGSIGTEYSFYSIQDSRSIPVSTGGSINITLGIL